VISRASTAGIISWTGGGGEGGRGAIEIRGVFECEIRMGAGGTEGTEGGVAEAADLVENVALRPAGTACGWNV